MFNKVKKCFSSLLCLTLFTLSFSGCGGGIPGFGVGTIREQFIIDVLSQYRELAGIINTKVAEYLSNNLQNTNNEQGLYKKVVLLSEISAETNVFIRIVENYVNLLEENKIKFSESESRLIEQIKDVVKISEKFSEESIALFKDLKVYKNDVIKGIEEKAEIYIVAIDTAYEELEKAAKKYDKNSSKQDDTKNINNICVNMADEEYSALLDNVTRLRDKYVSNLTNLFVLKNNNKISNVDEFNFDAAVASARLYKVSNSLNIYMDNILKYFIVEETHKEGINKVEDLLLRTKEYASEQIKRYDSKYTSAEQDTIKSNAKSLANRMYSKEKEVKGLLRETIKDAYMSTSVKDDTADTYPGSVGDDMEILKEQVVEIDLTAVDYSYTKMPVGDTVNTIESTGFYARPGDTIVIEAPENVSGVDVQIGAHTDWITSTNPEDWKRQTDITVRKTLKPGINKVSCPFGGIIYLVKTVERTGGKLTVKISGAVKAMQFKLGENTVEEWKENIEEYSVPWGELVGNRVIITVPANELKKLENPEEILNVWDKIVEDVEELASLSKDALLPHKSVEKHHRYIGDIQISAGAMHAGYPIMFLLNGYVQRALDVDQMKTNGWGFYHELGHNYQQYPWKWPQMVEVTNNLYCMYILEKNGAPSRLDEKDSKGQSEHDRALIYVNTPNPNKDYNDDKQLAHFTRLVMPMQLRYAYGWEFYKTLMTVSREENTDNVHWQAPGDPMARRVDYLVLTASEITGNNLLEFFDRWGVKYLEETANKVNAMNLPKPEFEIWNLTAPMESMKELILFWESFEDKTSGDKLEKWTISEDSTGEVCYSDYGSDLWYSKDQYAAVYNLGLDNTGIVNVEYDFIPLDTNIDAVMAHVDSSTKVSDYSQMATIVRATKGVFDARNGGTFSKINTVKWYPFEQYHIRISIDLNSKKYNAYITGKDNIEVIIAENYAFRTGAPVPDDIGKLILQDRFDEGYVIKNYRINGKEVSAPSQLALKLQGNSVTEEVYAKRNFSSQESAMSVEFSFMVENLQGVRNFQLQSDTRVAVKMKYENGKLFNDSLEKTEFPDINPYKWYNVKLIVDVSSNKYNLYLDGILVMENISFISPVNEINALQFSTSGEAVNKLYIDNVIVKSMQIVD